MTKPPFFSVLIPSYNRPEFVGAAIGSVLASRFGDFELVVSDDCSPRRDEISAVIDTYRNDPRLRVHMQTSNLREAANREFLLTAARADWHVILGDDDLLYPNALGVLADNIRDHPQCELFTFGYTIIDERSRPRFSRRALKPLRIHRDDPAILEEFLASDAFPFWFYFPATFCAHKRVHERIKPNRNIGIGDDVQYLLDFVNTGGAIQVIPDVLMCYRKMDPRASNLQLNQSGATLSNVYSRYRIFQELQGRADICEELRPIVTGPSFRQRFVYDTIAGEAGSLDEIADAVGMEPVHRAELFRYYRFRIRKWTLARGYVARCLYFIRLFGWDGFIDILRVFRERYRSRPVQTGGVS